MSALTKHARSMVAYNNWANGKILDAAGTMPPEAFRRVVDTLAHCVGTEMHWYALWTAGDAHEPSGELSYDDVRALFAQADAALDGYASRMTDTEWERTEAWWLRWGVDAKAPAGMTLFQVIYHGIQHRAEVAMVLTEEGCSPGDLDYLVFMQETAAS